MKTAILIFILAILVGIVSIVWINHDINQRVEYKKQYKAHCDTDAFNYEGVRPDWCKQ